MSFFNFMNARYTILLLMFAFLEHLVSSMGWLTRWRQDLRRALHRSLCLALCPASLRGTWNMKGCKMSSQGRAGENQTRFKGERRLSSYLKRTDASSGVS
jgi:hypothetical protein